VIGDTVSSSRPTVLLALGLMANLAPIATFAAVMPEITPAWRLSASEAGWISGIYFAGYAAAVPILASLTDRSDGRWVFAGSSLVGAGASLAFAGYADGFWMALVLRFLSGVALAGVHMPGLKLLAERTGDGRGRAAALSIPRLTRAALRSRSLLPAPPLRRSDGEARLRSAGSLRSSRSGRWRCCRLRARRCRPWHSASTFGHCCATAR
jgi:hypothetical protein